MSGIFDFYAILLRRVEERAHNVFNITATRVPNLQVIYAVDGQKLTEEDIASYHSDGYFPKDVEYDHVMHRPFLNGQLACWLSHVKLWEKLAAQDHLTAKPFHVIIEDDAIITPNFLDLIKKYEPFIENANADYINLFLHPGQRKPTMKHGDIYPIVPGIWGTQCYIIPHKRLQWMIKQIKPLKTAIDEQMTRIPNLRAFLIYDAFLSHDEIQSEIPLAIKPKDKSSSKIL